MQKFSLQKESLRKIFLSKRISLPESEVKRLSKIICERLKKFESFDSFLFYFPIKNEVNLLELAGYFLEKGKTVAFPKLIDGEIKPIKVESLKEFAPGKFSVPEPIGNNPVEKIDVVFVPGIVFDLRGYRLGYGKGFYDKFLKNFNGISVGVCYDFQLLNVIPCEEHDIPVSAVITNSVNVYRLRNLFFP